MVAAVTVEAALRPVAGRDWSVQAVLAQQYPGASGAGDGWPGLLEATGRQARPVGD